MDICIVCRKELRRDRDLHIASCIKKRDIERNTLMFGDKFKPIVILLKEDATMKLSEMSKKTGIPVSTLWGRLQKIKKHYKVVGVFVSKQ